MNLDYRFNLDTLSSEEDSNNNFYNQGQFIEKFLTENKQIEAMTNDLTINNNCLMQKRGRKTHFSNKKKPHIGIAFDNMQSKIQVHFFNFIINISNDALKTICKNTKFNFKNIDYNLKKKVSDEYFQMLKSLSIKQILKMNISSKYIIFAEDHNKQIIDRISNTSLWLDKFFNMNYLGLFNYYYNRGRPINKINFEDKEIMFSKRTQTFYDLLKKNIFQEKYLINTAKMVYLNGYDTLRNNLFVIIKAETVK